MLTNSTEDQDFVFEVIAPSIPGFAYSSAPLKMGFNAAQCARTFNLLMKRLGHDKYYLQGGGLGPQVVQHIALLYPTSLYGLHTNLIMVRNPSTALTYLLAALLPSGWVIDKQDEAKIFPISENLNDGDTESVYELHQKTKPDTVGVGLGTSPLGLAAYVLEKFSTWTNKDYRGLSDGGLILSLNMNDLLTNLMIYWTTNSMTSAARFYKESKNDFESGQPISVPAGLASLQNNIIRNPKAFAKSKYKNIVQYSDIEEGGHFAALEVPRLLHKDFISFVSKVEEMETSMPHKTEL